MSKENENLDVKSGESSTPTVETVVSTTTQTPPTETKTVEDVIQDVFKQSQSSSEQEGEKSAVLKSNSTEKKEEDESEDKEKSNLSEKEETKSEEKQTEEDKGPVPYDRFAEVNKAKVELESKFKEVEPLAKAQQSVIDYCANNGISEQQYGFWMEVAALASRDPGQALAKLSPMIEQFKSSTGEILPKDLQEMVDNNEIPLALAKRLAKAENNGKFVQQRSQMTEQQLVQQKQQAYVQELQTSMQSWIGSKKNSDPDFTPKSKESDPDGKFEFFTNKLALDAQKKGVKSVQELIAMSEMVYAQVDASVKRFAPKPNGIKVLSSTKSSSSSKPEPKTVDDVIAARAAKHGIQFEVPVRK